MVLIIPDDDLNVRCAKCEREMATALLTHPQSIQPIPLCDACQPAVPIQAAA